MVNQKLISFKVDATALVALDDLCVKIGCNRNKFLNFLVRFALDNACFYECSLVTALSLASKELSDV